MTAAEPGGGSEHPSGAQTDPAAARDGTPAAPGLQSQTSTVHEEQAAKAIQASYRSHITRRSMNGMSLRKDPDEAWFGVVDQVLGHEPKRPSFNWRRATHDASIVGKGASMGDNSLMLKKEHWLEATDRQHRYGSNLTPYHAAWAACSSTQPLSHWLDEGDGAWPFFHWLDEGDGAWVELPEVPREKLAREKLHYLSSEERAAVAAAVGADGLLHFVGSGDAVHTLSPEDSADLEADPEAWRAKEQALAALTRGGDANVSKEEKAAAKKARNSNKWIFVASADMTTFYIAAKKKGTFGHSSFLAGGAVGAAGQIAVDHGRIVKLAPLSGHYTPTVRHYIAFLDRLTELGVDLSTALLLNPFDDEPPPCAHDLRRARLDALDDKER